MGMFIGAWNTELLAGLVIRTIGGKLAGGGGGPLLTVTWTGSERVEAPPLSVALAVRRCGPTGALLQTSTNGR